MMETPSWACTAWAATLSRALAIRTLRWPEMMSLDEAEPSTWRSDELTIRPSRS